MDSRESRWMPPADSRTSRGAQTVPMGVTFGGAILVTGVLMDMIRTSDGEATDIKHAL